LIEVIETLAWNSAIEFQFLRDLVFLAVQHFRIFVIAPANQMLTERNLTFVKALIMVNFPKSCLLKKRMK
jgi:hypothetical protein